MLIPQRFQVVNDLSAFKAGWRLLALMLCSPLGSVTSGYLVQKVKVPPIYVFLAAAILQTVGLALMGTLNVLDPHVPSAQYGYQVILGLGIGLTLSSLLIGAPTVIKDKDTGMSYGGLRQKSWDCQDSSDNALHQNWGRLPKVGLGHVPGLLKQTSVPLIYLSNFTLVCVLFFLASALEFDSWKLTG